MSPGCRHLFHRGRCRSREIRMRSVPFLARAVAGLAFAAFSFAAAAQDLPRAAVRNVDDSFFGTTVTDPYRYFENVKDPQVAAWMKAHSDHAHKTLTHIAERDALLAKLVKYDSSASSRVTGATRVAGGVWFF